MATQLGWKSILHLSSDGGSSWFETDELTSFEPSFEPQNSELRTINNNGRLVRKPNTTDITVSAECYFSPENQTYKILKQAIDTKKPIFAKIFSNKDNIANHLVGKAVISSTGNSFNAEDVGTLSFELGFDYLCIVGEG
jgi:hypothetical protein